MGTSQTARARVVAVVISSLLAAALLVVGASAASASARSWDREVTDSVGRTAPSNVDETIDGDFVYWSYPVGRGSFKNGMTWELRQLTISTGAVRTIATVKNGMFGSVKANAGRVSFSTHRRVRSRQRGELVTTESLLFTMAATDPLPTELRRDSAVSRFSLSGRGKRQRTRLQNTCGKLPAIADVSDTGRTLTMLSSKGCDSDPDSDSAWFIGYYAYDPGAAAAVDLGPAGSKMQGAIRRGKLIDLGSWNPEEGDRRMSIQDLASGAVNRLPFRGYAYELIPGDHGRFAVMSDDSTARRESKIFARIYSLDSGQPLMKLRIRPEREITSFYFCPDGLVQVTEFPAVYRATMTFRDYSGKIVSVRDGPRGESTIMSATCSARTLTAAVMAYDDDGEQIVKIQRYEF